MANEPTNFTLTATGSSTANSTWSNNASYVAIWVYRKVSGGSYSRVDILAGSATSYDHSSLNPGTTYYAYVYAIDPDGASNEDSCTTLLSAPSGLVTTATGTSTIEVTWTNGDPYDSIEVWQQEGGGSWNLADTISGSATSWIYNSVPANTNENFKVRGKVDSNYTDYSNDDSATCWVDIKTETLNLTDSYSDSHLSGTTVVVETITLSDVVSDVVAYIDTITETITLSDVVQDSVSLRTDYSYFLGSSDGKLYLYAPTNYSDAGSSISSHWRSKTTDFTDQHPQCLNQFTTCYGAKLIYVDLSADTPVTLYYSIDGGATWTSGGTNTVGNGDGCTKDTLFYFIETGKYWDFKIEHSSTAKEFQWLALELDFMPRGEFKAIS